MMVRRIGRQVLVSHDFIKQALSFFAFMKKRNPNAIFLDRTTMNLNLDTINEIINELALAKKYSQEPSWLAWKLGTEVGELLKAMEEGRKKDVGEEWADVEHILHQILTVYEVKNLEAVLLKKVESNWNSKKKTLGENGVIVRR